MGNLAATCRTTTGQAVLLVLFAVAACVGSGLLFITLHWISCVAIVAYVVFLADVYRRVTGQHWRQGYRND